jgi:hypothetical protein
VKEAKKVQIPQEQTSSNNQTEQHQFPDKAKRNRETTLVESVRTCVFSNWFTFAKKSLTNGTCVSGMQANTDTSATAMAAANANNKDPTVAASISSLAINASEV